MLGIQTALVNGKDQEAYIIEEMQATSWLVRISSNGSTRTSWKKHLSWEYSSDTSLPRKIFATKFPPRRSVFVVMFRADNSSCACMYSSMSCSPVTSGAPSHTTKSARSPRKCPMIISAVDWAVISPWIHTTPGIGAISCKSTATIFGRPFTNLIQAAY